MTDEEIEQIIDAYIKKASRLLPDNFETEDLLEDLKAHIYEGLGHKQQINPSESPVILVQEVLKELGTPEEIAEESSKERVPDQDYDDADDRFMYYAVRLVAAIIVAIIAALIVDFVTEGAVDFAFAFFVLVAFAVIEWFVRAKQIGES